jgi:hypothetical protein
MIRPFKVGVFEHPGKRRVKLAAYSSWYNPSWEGCCEHTVEANNGTEAKVVAMREHREKCMSAA